MARASNYTINGLTEKEQMDLAIIQSMQAEQKANENRRIELAIQESIKNSERKVKANENKKMELVMKQRMDAERKASENIAHEEEEQMKLAINASMNRPIHLDLNTVSLQEKWFIPRFYDELIKRETDKLNEIEINSAQSIKEAKRTKNSDLVKGLENDLASQKEQTENFLYQFKEIQKNIENKELIMSIITSERNLNAILRNIIVVIFEYEIGSVQIEADAKLTFPPDLVDPYSFIIKTSSNKHDCLIHSILTDISEEFRRLNIKHRNVIAFFFRKIVFPLIPDLDEDDKHQLLVDPTIGNNFYLDENILGKISNYYNLNFIIITSTKQMMPIQIEDNPSPFHIIYFDQEHFSAVKVKNKYNISFKDGQKYFHFEGGYSSKSKISKKNKSKKHISKKHISKKHISKKHISKKHISKKHISKKHISKKNKSKKKSKKI